MLGLTSVLEYLASLALLGLGITGKDKGASTKDFISAFIT
jgi:hypothetical protein